MFAIVALRAAASCTLLHLRSNVSYLRFARSGACWRYIAVVLRRIHRASQYANLYSQQPHIIGQRQQTIWDIARTSSG